VKFLNINNLQVHKMDRIAIEIPDEATYLNCSRCGLCLAVCPTYREYLKETVSPRGRVALARQELEGQLEPSPNLVEQMYNCFGCMACNEICPVGIRPAELVLWMRTMSEQSNSSQWKEALFGGLIPYPERMEYATLSLRLYQGLGLRQLVYWLGLQRILPAYFRDLEAMLPQIPKRPLRKILLEVTVPRGELSYRVGFFLGCAQNLLFANESRSTVRVLARNGCHVTTPSDVQCCGMPARGYGRLDLVKQQARHNIAVFERYPLDLIVTDCATCGSMLKEYAALFKGDPMWAERATAFSQKVRDVSEFLVEIPLEKPQGQLNGRVTYHDPCHLRRGQKVWNQPRTLLKLIDGLDIVELPEADWCCGSAGSQLITHPEMSRKVMDRKMDNLASTGADIIASGCPGCQMQLQSGIRRRGLKVQVVHPITLLDNAYEAFNGK
jgi:glycolate oxidase iron-sulfur subunit